MKHLFNIRLASMAVALAFAGATFTACEDDIEITNSTSNPWGELDGTFGSVRSAAGAKMGTTLTLRNNEDATGYVYFELSKVSDQDTKVTFKIDNSALSTYNAANGTSYEMYPNVTLENEGKTTITAGKRKSELLAVNVPAGKTGNNYAVAITATADNGTTIASNNASYVYLIKSIQIPSYTPRDIKNIVYVEVNNENPLNAGEYTIGDEKAPFFDIVSIFAANINLDKEGSPYISCNEQTTFVLHNADRIIRPLQEKGIKVHLSILGNHDDAGMRSLSDEGAKVFAKELKAYADIYGLDGFDFDDEYSSYDKGAYQGSSKAVVNNASQCTQERYANLIYECRQLMPKESNISFGIYWYRTSDYPKGDINGVSAADMVDYTVFGSYGSFRALSGFSNKIQAPYAITLAGASTSDGSPIGIRSNSTYLNNVKNNGYGMFAFYNLNNSRSVTRVFNEMSNIIYGQPVEWNGKYYERTEFVAKTGKSTNYEDYLGTWTVTASKSLYWNGSSWAQGDNESFIINIIEKENGKSYNVYGWDGREETQKYPFELTYDNGMIKIASQQTIHTPDTDDGNEWVMSFASGSTKANWNATTTSRDNAFNGEMAPNGTLMLLDYSSMTASKNANKYAFSLFKKDGTTYQAAIKAENERLAGWYILSR